MILWPIFLPDLLPHLPMCPVPLVVHEIRRAAQLFFSKTRVFRADLPVIDVPRGTQAIAVTPTDAALAVVRVEEACLDGRPLSADTDFYQDVPGVLCLVAPTHQDATLRVKVSLQPADSADGVPDEFAPYQKAITQGAKALLMRYPNKAWTNPELAALCDAEFSAAINSGNIAAARSFGTARITANLGWC